ncbi:MAG TPA: hypothetical protein VFV95_13770 [Vicinamibacterales bacterium]|nr:hypothetical protein [Vicinamibacterales bacterium]
MKHETPVATLWELDWDDTRVSCAVYRHRDGFELRVSSPTAVIVAEQFQLQPRALARAHALRDQLTRRGWRKP